MASNHSSHFAREEPDLPNTTIPTTTAAKLFKRQDPTTALICLGALLFLLLVIIMYTRMWTQNHNGWEYLSRPISSHAYEDDTQAELIPSGHRRSLREVITAKTRTIVNNFSGRFSSVKRNNHRTVQYHNLESIQEQNESDTA